jgi:hypothetical protein
LIIRLIIQTILLDPSGAVWIDDAGNVSRLDPSGTDQIDAEHPSRNRKVVGSNPTSGSKKPPRSAPISEPAGPPCRTCYRREDACVAALEPARWRTR